VTNDEVAGRGVDPKTRAERLLAESFELASSLASPWPRAGQMAVGRRWNQPQTWC
jgi:hypothetical protein